MPRDILDLTDSQYARMQDLAERIAQDTFAYGVYNTTYDSNEKKTILLSPNDILFKMLKGYELGFSPIASLSVLYNEHGQLTAHAKTIIALIRNSGKLEYANIVESTDEICHIKFKRTDDPNEYEEIFTFDQANLEGFAKTANWRVRPRDMCFYRCWTRISYKHFGDVTLGMIGVGEVGTGGSVYAVDESELQKHINQIAEENNGGKVIDINKPPKQDRVDKRKKLDPDKANILNNRPEETKKPEVQSEADKEAEKEKKIAERSEFVRQAQIALEELGVVVSTTDLMKTILADFDGRWRTSRDAEIRQAFVDYVNQVRAMQASNKAPAEQETFEDISDEFEDEDRAGIVDVDENVDEVLPEQAKPGDKDYKGPSELAIKTFTSSIHALMRSKYGLEPKDYELGDYVQDLINGQTPEEIVEYLAKKYDLETAQEASGNYAPPEEIVDEDFIVDDLDDLYEDDDTPASPFARSKK